MGNRRIPGCHGKPFERDDDPPRPECQRWLLLEVHGAQRPGHRKQLLSLYILGYIVTMESTCISRRKKRGMWKFTASLPLTCLARRLYPSIFSLVDHQLVIMICFSERFSTHITKLLGTPPQEWAGAGRTTGRSGYHFGLAVSNKTSKSGKGVITHRHYPRDLWC